jgi:hypothetical protein
MLDEHDERGSSMNRRYTPQHAEELIPFLRSIADEIGERSRAIEHLERVLASKAEKRAPLTRESRDAGAALAHQRRELRLAKQELERLGCIQDEEDPLRIRIPGEDGTLETGYAWIPSDDRLHRNEMQAAG